MLPLKKPDADIMKILVCSINFLPELTGIGKYSGEMAEWLCQRGHKVRVVTAPPHYPEWSVRGGYSSWKYQRERHYVPGAAHHVDVLRCPLWVPRVPRGLRRVLHLLSFSLSTWPVMLRSIFWKPDIVLLIAPTLFCSIQSICTAHLSRAVSWIHIQDFELDAAFELRDFSSELLRSVSERIERALLKKFDRGSSISRRMLDRLVNKGIDPARCVLFANWVDTSSIYPIAGAVPLRQELAIPENKVIALYSGSIGKKQGIEFLVEVSRRMVTDSNVHFVFCGNGPSRQMLELAAGQLTNFTLLPLQPASRLNELLNLADIHLLPQVASAGDLVMPSKLTGMMASGRAILATAESGTQLHEVLANRGVVVSPGNLESFVTELKLLAGDRVLRDQLGQKAREYALAALDRENILGKFEREMIAACQPHALVPSGDVAEPTSIEELDERYASVGHEIEE